MEPVATLRATNCTSLQPLGQAIVAACGPKTAYLLNAESNEEMGSCVAPRETLTYTLWLPPGAPAAAKEVLVVYGAKDTSKDEEGYCIFVQRQGERDGGFSQNSSQSNAKSSQSPSALLVVRLSLPEPPAGPLQSLSIVHHTVLCVQTASAVAFYALDPAAFATGDDKTTAEDAVVPVVKMGECEMSSAEGAPLHVLASPTEPVVVVAALVGGSRGTLHARVVRLSQGASAVVERSTDPKDGAPLPKGVAIDADDLLAVRVWWTRQELLLLHKDGGKARRNAVLGFSLNHPAGGNTLSTWSKRPNGEPEFVTAATRPVLSGTSDLCCTAVGDVWALDSSSSNCLLLRNVTSPYLSEVEVQGSSMTAKTSVAVDAARVFLQAGRGIYAMPLIAAAAEAHHSADAAAIASHQGTPQKRRPDGAPARGRASTLCDWLLVQQQQQGMTVSSSSLAGAAIAAPDLAAALLGDSGDSKTAPESVVRDVLYVERLHETAGLTFKHGVLDVLLAKDKAREKQDRGALKYAALAQSLHPFTVLLLLSHAAHPQAKAGSNDALLLATAAYLCQKPALQGSAAFHRMADQTAATEHYFASVTPSALGQKRLAAALCRTAVTALATGSLDAASMLFAVADVCVAATYGRRQQREADLSAPTGSSSSSSSSGGDEEEKEEAQHLEAEIADSISVLSSYADWALSSAATALGTMTAHVGEPSNNRKEAALRDGRSHPIRTSRTIDIEPLQLPNRTTNTLTTK